MLSLLRFFLLFFWYVEALTDRLIRRSWGHIQEIESLGGMAAAIETGLPKMRT